MQLIFFIISCDSKTNSEKNVKKSKKKLKEKKGLELENNFPDWHLKLWGKENLNLVKPQICQVLVINNQLLELLSVIVLNLN